MLEKAMNICSYYARKGAGYVRDFGENVYNSFVEAPLQATVVTVFSAALVANTVGCQTSGHTHKAARPKKVAMEDLANQLEQYKSELKSDYERRLLPLEAERKYGVKEIGEDLAGVVKSPDINKPRAELLEDYKKAIPEQDLETALRLADGLRARGVDVDDVGNAIDGAHLVKKVTDNGVSVNNALKAISEYQAKTGAKVYAHKDTTSGKVTVVVTHCEGDKEYEFTSKDGKENMAVTASNPEGWYSSSSRVNEEGFRSLVSGTAASKSGLEGVLAAFKKADETGRPVDRKEAREALKDKLGIIPPGSPSGTTAKSDAADVPFTYSVTYTWGDSVQTITFHDQAKGGYTVVGSLAKVVSDGDVPEELAAKIMGGYEVQISEDVLRSMIRKGTLGTGGKKVINVLDAEGTDVQGKRVSNVEITLIKTN